MKESMAQAIKAEYDPFLSIFVRPLLWFHIHPQRFCALQYDEIGRRGIVIC
jgi:hypothetical protein